jgi:type I restriction enzyme M protein
MLNNFAETVHFIWSIAELLRDAFRRGQYQDVILPFTVLRRLGAAANAAFFSAAPYPFQRLPDDPAHLAENLHACVAAFNPAIRELLAHFELERTIRRLDQAGLLLPVVERFAAVDLHPERVSHHAMGAIFEELVRKFNEALDEHPGEHFTPREVVQLMTALLIAPDRERLRASGVAVSIADPCCGTGGMLFTAQDTILELNPSADVRLFGQEINPHTYAICQADLLLKNPTGYDPANIRLGSTLSADGHAGLRFDYQLTNPPYGKDWRADRAAVLREAALGRAGRFGAGVPRVSDGQLLFLQHMLSRMKAPAEGGGRVAVVMSGSPLFAGDAGSGESDIRRWILENDWLEALVALPEQLFYNTDIATYVWVLSNRKAPQRRGCVQLIDASDLWAALRKSLGDKRRELRPEHVAEIVRLYTAGEDNTRSKILPATEFGYCKIVVQTSTKRDTERVPLGTDVNRYFEREVRPFAPTARIDSQDGRVGYAIHFNRYFFRYEAPRPPADLYAQVQALADEIGALGRRAVTRGLDPTAPTQDSGQPWLGDIPAHWQLARLKFVAQVRMGQSPPSRDYNTQGHGAPFLQGNAEFGPQHPAPRLYCPTATQYAQAGDLLLSVRAPVGALNVADQRYGIGRGLCAIRPDPALLDGRYAWYMLHVARAGLNAVATGSTFEAVSVEQVRDLRCPLPPLAEQQAIAAYLDAETTRLDALIAKHHETAERLSEYRAALISALVTGTIQ